MYQIHITITPEGFTRLDLDTPREEFPEADAFYRYIQKYIWVLETTAKTWPAGRKMGGRLLDSLRIDPEDRN